MKLKRASSLLFGPIHGGIGMRQKLVDIVIIGRVNGNADTDSDQGPVFPKVKW